MGVVNPKTHEHLSPNIDIVNHMPGGLRYAKAIRQKLKMNSKNEFQGMRYA